MASDLLKQQNTVKEHRKRPAHELTLELTFSISEINIFKTFTHSMQIISTISNISILKYSYFGGSSKARIGTPQNSAFSTKLST